MSEADLSLFYAVFEDDVSALSVALADGAAVNLAHGCLWSDRYAEVVAELRKKHPDQFATEDEWAAFRKQQFQKDLELRTKNETELNRTWTPLPLAVAWGRVALIAPLLAAGANSNHADEEGETPLLIAAYQDDIATVLRLLEAGASARAANKDGITALHRAASYQNVALVQALIAAGADVQAKTRLNATPLLSLYSLMPHDFLAHLGSQGAHLERMSLHLEGQTETTLAIVERLLAAGAEPNVVCSPDSEDPLGEKLGIVELPQSPLAFACGSKGNAKLIALLLEAGADPNYHPGYPPILCAHELAVVQLLKAHGAKLEVQAVGMVGGHTTPLSTAAEDGDLERIRFLWDEGLRDPDSIALRTAVIKDQVEALAFFLDQGADIDADYPMRMARKGEPIAGVTLLMLAAHRGKAKSVGLLLERGAQKERRDSTGKTAWDYANGPTPAEKVFEEKKPITTSEEARVEVEQELEKEHPGAQLPQDTDPKLDSLFDSLAKMGQLLQERIDKESTNRATVRALLHPPHQVP